MDALEYQTWLLKVSIHCEGCRRKVKKVLQSIDGVFTTKIDPQQQKVTVTGSVGVETLIRKLGKAGKHAEVWPENVAGKGKDSNKAKKKEKNSEQRDQESVLNHASANTKSNKDKGFEKAEKCNGERKSSGTSKTGAGSQDKSPVGGQAPRTDNKGGQGESGGGDSGKKKKKKKIQKAQNGGGGTGSNRLSSASTCAPAHTGSQLQCPGQVVGQMNLSPTRQQSYLYPETCYPPLVHFATSNNRLCLMGTVGGPSYYVPQLPYMCADPYQLQSPPLISFDIFSDENVNGCSVM